MNILQQIWIKFYSSCMNIYNKYELKFTTASINYFNYLQQYKLY